jgi:hypothetical protein
MKPRFRRRLFGGILLAFTAYAQRIDEYQVKAAFLYNFARFVEWPEQSFKTDKDPMRICVIGQDTLDKSLEQTVNGRTVLGRPFVITDISDIRQTADCQMLFVGSSEQKRLKAILAAIRSPGILTVGEADDFASQGGIVNFKVDAGRVRFEINVDAAARAKLRISSKVLNLAQIVTPGNR